MKLSLLKYFAWISLLVIAFSCRAPQIVFSGETVGNAMISIDSGSFEKTTYKARVLYKDKELPGLLLVKKDAGGNFRVAFYNEMGMTYLEGTFFDQKLVIQNMIPVLSNKRFLRNFEKSLQALLYQNLHSFESSGHQ